MSGENKGRRVKRQMKRGMEKRERKMEGICMVDKMGPLFVRLHGHFPMIQQLKRTYGQAVCVSQEVFHSRQFIEIIQRHEGSEEVC